MASWKAVGVEENMLLRLGRKERPKEGDTDIPNTCPLHPPTSGFRAWKGMVLYFVGLGLADEKDVTVRGLEIIKACDRVYLEHYTSVLGVGKEKLEVYYGREVILADREQCENHADKIIEEAKSKKIAFLVVGSPFAATTHMDLMTRAQSKGVKTHVVHNASVMNAAAACGLQLYQFGQTVSICLFEEKWRPMSFYEKIEVNRKIGLHTMCLLDIKIKEVSYANLMKGNDRVYEKPRFLTADMACRQMLETEKEKKSGVLTESMPAMALCRLGQPNQLIVAGSIGELAQLDFGAPLHTLVIPGPMHIIEKEMYEHFHHSKTLPDQKPTPSPPYVPPTRSDSTKPDKKESTKHSQVDIMTLIHKLTANGNKAEAFQKHMLSAAAAYLTLYGDIDTGGPSMGKVTDEKEEEEEDNGYEDRVIEQRRRLAKLRRPIGKRAVKKQQEVDSDGDEDEDEEEDSEEDADRITPPHETRSVSL